MLGEGEERATVSKLNLVDLAGSERTKKTGVTGQALKVGPLALAERTRRLCQRAIRMGASAWRKWQPGVRPLKLESNTAPAAAEEGLSA